MRTIGLIGGMSWESSAEYYRLINQQVRGSSGKLKNSRRAIAWDCLTMYSKGFNCRRSNRA